jgi:hypothetical protein
MFLFSYSSSLVNGIAALVALPVLPSTVSFIDIWGAKAGVMDFSGLANIFNLSVVEGDTTNIILPVATTWNGFNMQDNKLTVDSVNAILIAADASGVLNKVLTLFEQHPDAPPSGAGLAAKTALGLKGWIVITD